MSLAPIRKSLLEGSFQLRIVRHFYNPLQVLSIVKLSDSVLVDKSELSLGQPNLVKLFDQKLSVFLSANN